MLKLLNDAAKGIISAIFYKAAEYPWISSGVIVLAAVVLALVF